MKLEIGYNADFEVRKEFVLLEKGVNFTVLYLSDLHLNRFSETLVNRILECVETHNPTIVLLGGDYVDTHRGLFYFEKLLEKLSQRQHVFAIAGNHDYFLGLQKIKNACDKYQIRWIDNETECIDIQGFKIRIVGTRLQPAFVKADFHILFLHQPIDITLFQNQFDLVFAGHLHGCQVVFWETEKGLFPGKWFYKGNILKKQARNCLYLVSKGLGDTLPIRFNCKKDLILVEINVT
jgi:uncharacterized protein